MSGGEPSTQEPRHEESAFKDVDRGTSKLFFIRRRPRMWGVSRKWVRPPDAEYERLLEWEGFISIKRLKIPVSEILEADCRELEQHLMDHFWQMDQEAKYFQNLYYLYQWMFILFAFLTTAIAATNVLFHSLGTQASLGILSLTELLAIITAIISGWAAAISFLGANRSPQKNWFKARVKAESLRSLYFTYLARQTPFDIANDRERIQQLRRKVLSVLREARGDQGQEQESVRRTVSEEAQQ
ncbi:MAG: DUF4231 domain-containing protein [Anaerolineae bacterium]|jgi:hypothetical protein|nr:DUF4231 domain-containing protein [Anaerolineae bacterium]